MSNYYCQSSSAYRVDGTTSGVDMDAIIQALASSRGKNPVAIAVLLEEQHIKDGMFIPAGSADGDLDLFVVGCTMIGTGHSVALQGYLKTTGHLPGDTDPVLTRVYADPETAPKPDDPDYVDPITSGSRELPAGSYVTIVYDVDRRAGYVEGYSPYGNPELIFCSVDTEEFPEFGRRDDVPGIPMGCRAVIFGSCQPKPSKGKKK